MNKKRVVYPNSLTQVEVIICRHLYWTLLNPRETFDEWKRILTHNGRVLLIDGKKNPPKEERPKVYTNVHEGRIYSEELVEKVQGVDVTIEEIATNLTSAGFINITSYSLDDIAQYHHDQSEEEDKLKYPENEVNIVAGVVRKD